MLVARLAWRRRFVASSPPHGIDAFEQHQPTDGPQEDDVHQRDYEIELAHAAQKRKDPDTDRGACKTADQKHSAEFHIERAAPEMGDRPRNRRRYNLVRAGGDGDDRRDIVKDQQWGDEKAATNAEHSGKEPDGRPHAENDEDVHRQFCDGQIDCHNRPRMMTAPAGRFPSRPRSNAHLTAKSLPEAFDQL